MFHGAFFDASQYAIFVRQYICAAANVALLKQPTHGLERGSRKAALAEMQRCRQGDRRTKIIIITNATMRRSMQPKHVGCNSPTLSKVSQRPAPRSNASLSALLHAYATRRTGDFCWEVVLASFAEGSGFPGQPSKQAGFPASGSCCMLHVVTTCGLRCQNWAYETLCDFKRFLASLCLLACLVFAMMYRRRSERVAMC